MRNPVPRVNLRQALGSWLRLARLAARRRELLSVPPSSDPAGLSSRRTDTGQSAAQQTKQLESEACAEPIEGGRTIGPYRLMRRIGTGGMGQVYLAERFRDGFEQRVALKVVHGDARRVRPDHFRREREILARLHHPYIATLLDGGESNGQLYYTMEWVDGIDIAEFCDRLDIEDRIALLVKVGEALAYAHRNLVIHRDIKPSNILVTREGVPKLLDFGIAKSMDTLDSTTRTQLGPLTPEYAAPEQFRGEASTVATDVFQYATLCYRILSARLPYAVNPENRFAWSRAVNEDEPLPLSHVMVFGDAHGEGRSRRARYRFVADLDAILRKALSKAPDRRYPTIDAMLADFSAFLDRRPVSARRASAAYFAWRWIVRRPYLSAGAALAIALLVLITVLSVREAGIARNNAVRAQQEAGRADQTRAFVMSLFDVIDPGVGRGASLSANEVLERGAQRVSRKFADQPYEKAQLLKAIGTVYLNIGDWPRGKEPLSQAVALLRTLPEASPLDLGIALRTFGVGTGKWGGDPVLAMNLLAEANRVLLMVETPESQEELVSSYSYSSTIRAESGDFAGAEDDLTQARHFAELAGLLNRQVGARLSNSRGRLFLQEGKFAEASTEYEFSFNIYKRELGVDHYRTLRTQAGLAFVKAQLGDLKEARSLMEDVAERQLRTIGDKHSDYMTSVSMLGGIEKELGLNDDALDHLSTAVRLWGSAPGDYKRDQAIARTDIGSILVDQKKYADALVQFDGAIEILRHRQDGRDPDLAVALAHRVDALIPLNRPGDASKDADEALSIARPLHDWRPDFMATVLMAAAAASHAQGDDERARSLTREALEVGHKLKKAYDVRDLERRAAAIDPALATR
jgi:eukaryotic-like serine/threonine-protein kinase